jgi:hypothetical protein
MITDVAPSLTCEHVALVSLPPLSFKSGQDHYRWLWYAWFCIRWEAWPLASLV